ncbi:MAG: hypothetical protein U9O78_02730 [Patescibacteria group bacterium]|nr:hypothetical protein [Patescibacteria group bacterium]
MKPLPRLYGLGFSLLQAGLRHFVAVAFIPNRPYGREFKGGRLKNWRFPVCR